LTSYEAEELRVAVTRNDVFRFFVFRIIDTPFGTWVSLVPQRLIVAWIDPFSQMGSGERAPF